MSNLRSLVSFGEFFIDWSMDWSWELCCAADCCPSYRCASCAPLKRICKAEHWSMDLKGVLGFLFSPCGAANKVVTKNSKPL
ncbi:unnamed protein product [Linum trigynum]|uniref:Uncharacterized protein n=1 Tax=Linum trigynum TaxID=586398 RepID=A0AAV2FII8_9ROSI